MGHKSRDFDLGHAGGASPRQVEENQQRLRAALGGRWVPASLRQIHSAIVYEAGHAACSPAGSSAEDRAARRRMLEYHPAGWRTSEGSATLGGDPVSESESSSLEHHNSPAGDALVTSEPGVLLSVRTADCLPVLVADVKLHLIAAVHAGWRGALARVVEKTVGEMRRAFGSAPEDMVAALGPAIGRCCYEVGDEVVDAFRAQFTECDNFFCRPPCEREADYTHSRYSQLFHTQAPPGHRRERPNVHLDLAAVAQAQLLTAGLKASAIHHSGYCTACCPDLFFSYRRDGTQAGRMMAAIG
ncbi:MAG TPA: peptidoglycan editing factor PgeF, partial [Terriglobales bacterium]|nr:peptidoglycan editing factor PgeF [Terriglobales bacterium]